ncbi:MAG: hypothetical protein WCP28_15315 [Actinomycetes bacterium]
MAGTFLSIQRLAPTQPNAAWSLCVFEGPNAADRLGFNSLGEGDTQGPDAQSDCLSEPKETIIKDILEESLGLNQINTANAAAK